MIETKHTSPFSLTLNERPTQELLTRYSCCREEERRSDRAERERASSSASIASITISITRKDDDVANGKRGGKAHHRDVRKDAHFPWRESI